MKDRIIQLIVFIVISFAVMPIIPAVLKSIPETKENEMILFIGGIMPVIIIFFGIVTLFNIVRYVPEEEEDYYKDYIEENKKITRKDAEEILRLRFAKGEISSQEYTERMSRL